MGIFVFFLITLVIVLYYGIPLGLVYVISKLFHIKTKRPYLVTSVCVNLSATLIFIVYRMLTSIGHAPIQFLIFNSFLQVVLVAVSLVGLWKMRRWSVFVLFSGVVIALLFPIQATSLTLFSLVGFLPVVIAVIYYKKFK